jgi:hypothetical protein
MIKTYRTQAKEGVMEMNTQTLANYPVSITDRNFEFIHFHDYFGNECSLQQSSAWVLEDAAPGTSAIWLGIEDHRMHLTRSQVQVLVETLQRWIDTGSFDG